MMEQGQEIRPCKKEKIHGHNFNYVPNFVTILMWQTMKRKKIMSLNKCYNQLYIHMICHVKIVA